MRPWFLCAALLLASCALDDARPMPDGMKWFPPTGWVQYTQTASETVRPDGAASYCSPEEADSTCLSLLDAINRQVNRSHKYVPEIAGRDEWRVMGEGDHGDCEDFALTKRARLLEAGWPADNLRLGICRTPGGEHHGVLTADAAGTTWALDVRSRRLERWDHVDCEWTGRQAPDGSWRKI